MAVFNNGYPASYQPVYYPQPNYQMQTPQSTPNSQIIWVQGEAGAKSYLVAPNNTVQLWDSEAQTIYLKTADASGMPSMKILDYTIRDTSGSAPHAAQEYATKSELDAINEKIRGLKDELVNLTGRKRSARLLKEEEDDE